MVVSELICLPSPLQEMTVTATSLYLQQKLPRSIFSDIINGLLWSSTCIINSKTKLGISAAF